MVEADRFNAAAICIIVLLFESINEICSRSSACNLPLYFMAQFSVYCRSCGNLLISSVSASENDTTSTKSTSQKGHSIAEGYILPFLFSGAEHSGLLHI